MRVKAIPEMSPHALVIVDPVEVELLRNLSSKTTREGEEALMLAVLQDAIADFQEYILAKDRKGKELFQEAEAWILEQNGDSIFSFEYICEILGLEPNYLRKGLLEWKKAKLKSHHKSKRPCSYRP
jgi:hypothetical protein